MGGMEGKASNNRKAKPTATKRQATSFTATAKKQISDECQRFCLACAPAPYLFELPWRCQLPCLRSYYGSNMCPGTVIRMQLQSKQSGSCGANMH